MCGLQDCYGWHLAFRPGRTAKSVDRTDERSVAKVSPELYDLWIGTL
jgi:hypothetical protein